jgi:hypothetical protein
MDYQSELTNTNHHLFVSYHESYNNQRSFHNKSYQSSDEECGKIEFLILISFFCFIKHNTI